MTYELHFIRVRDRRVWRLPLAGTTIARRSALLPANSQRPALQLDYADAVSTCYRLNAHMRCIGLPGCIFPVIILP
jgi:hypothetical protein